MQWSMIHPLLRHAIFFNNTLREYEAGDPPSHQEKKREGIPMILLPGLVKTHSFELLSSSFGCKSSLRAARQNSGYSGLKRMD